MGKCQPLWLLSSYSNLPMLDMLFLQQQRTHICSPPRSSGGGKGQGCEEAVNSACLLRGLQVHKLPWDPAGPAVGARHQAAQVMQVKPHCVCCDLKTPSQSTRVSIGNLKCSCPRTTVITNYHELDGLKQQIYSLTVLEA